MNSSQNTTETLWNLRASDIYPLPQRSLEEEIFEIVVGCVLPFFGLTGNGLVCYVISRSRSTRSSMYFFLVQPAIADILVCSVSIPFTLMTTHRTPLLLIQDKISCKIVCPVSPSSCVSQHSNCNGSRPLHPYLLSSTISKPRQENKVSGHIFVVICRNFNSQFCI